MMSEPLARVDNLSKKFCRNLKRSLWYGVRDVGSELIGRASDRRLLRKDEFWALREVSLDLRPGETLGLIGHNGAGKTTLLRLMSGLIKPDQGSIRIRGRIQSLIALGAGFNPVLTGRENVYVNAAILGMSKAEIDRRFDEIVDFAGIEEFIDMPVQSYSSGMVVRLGFSIAAHLEPEILLVDEVLAVGDLAFKTKCQVRIQELRNRGVAIVLVSHNLHTISHVCSRAMTFEKGRVIYEGEPEGAIDRYRLSLLQCGEDPGDRLRGGTGEIKVLRFEVLNRWGSEQREFQVGEPARLRVHYQATEPVENPIFNVTMRVFDGDQVTGFRTDVDDLKLGVRSGSGYLDIVIPELNLLPNLYTMDAVIFHPDGFTFYDRLNQVGHLKVQGGLQINGISYLPHRYEASAPAGSPQEVEGAELVERREAQ